MSSGERARVRSPFVFARAFRQRGVNLIELVAVLVIVGVIGAVALPRFLNVASSSAHGRFAAETVSALRYAHRTAIGMQRTVCVAFTATTLTLTYLPTYGATNCSVGSPPGLGPPGGGATAYTVTASGSAAFTSFPGTPLSFDRLGRPSTGQTLQLNNGTQIVVAAETGHVQ